MSGFPRAASRRSYSWWWDSHIGPKNSKWLQENLTDIDAKVKSMIKLIEEDGDSFARRAEMYYKKRPELMKLVEEFYRAYRALAERYDNATGVLKQAQKTMIEAFPNQDLMGIIDDPADSTTSPPDIPSPLLAQLGEGRVRKTLNFRNTESLSESEKVSNFEREIQSLKDALAKLEAEKVAGETQYDQTLQKLNKLELEVSCSQENSRNLSIVAKKTEGEVEALRISLTKLEAEKEASLRQYERSLEMISNLENNASQAKEEVEELRKWAVKLESEKDEAHDQVKQSLEMISNLENKLELVEEEAKQVRERADNAEKEVQTLKQALAKLTEENTSNVLLYHQCLEKISILEQKLFFAEEEVMRLKGEIDTSVTKLKGAEEQCLTLQKSNESLNLEMGSLVLKMGSQSEELTEKQKELGKIWTCLEEERLRFVEAETNFQKLQHLYSQTQEQMKSLALEIGNKGQLLKDKETQNESLLDEIMRTNEENKSLNDVNVTSSISIGQMQNEISCLVESNENFESSVKQLQTENSDLKYTFEKEKAEKLLLLEKLAIMEQLIHKNALLEKSLSDLTAELEGARIKINDLEQSFEALLEEKSTILAEKATVMSQLQVMIENMEKIIEKNNFLENSLSDARRELDGLKTRSITLEASCESLEKEKFYLINEKDALISEGKTTQQTLESLEKRQRELEERYLGLENERESTSSKVDKLQISLDVEKKEHANFAQRTETQLAGMGQQILLLQEEVFSRRREFVDELNKAMDYQLEIFIVRRCVEDLREKNSSLLAECQKLAEGSIISEKVISELKHDNSEMLSKIEDTNNSLHQVLDDNQKLNVEMSVIVTLLGQLRLEAKLLDMKRITLERELETKNEESILSQNEATKLLELNGDLNLKISSLTFLLASLSKEIDEIKVVRNDQENEINKLKNLHEEFGLMTRLSETEAATLFEELQYSTVFQALLEENFYKLKNKAILKDEKIEVLEKKINNLEGVNGGVVAQLAGCAPLLMSLKDSVSSLESLTLHNKLQKSHNEGTKEVDPVSNENLNSAQNALNVNSELNDLQFRIKVIEKAMVQKERENIEANNKLEAAMKTIDDLKFKGGLNREYSVPISDNSELENEISTKDIILDVNSESSPRELKRGERKSQRKIDRSWDSADLDRNFNLSIGRDNRVKSPPREMLKRQKSRYRNSEIVAEKELGIDKLQISRSFSQRSQEVTKTKILERLNSDAEKLTNLQIAVQDLMKKTKIIENGKKGKSVYESDTLRDQLEEAEEAILELSEYNDKLIRSAEKISFSSNVKSGLDSEESGRARRRRISEQAKKVSEKIGRLQLEVQKIQFVLMKIDNEKDESNVKSRFSEMRRKVMLRDYLYGVRSPSHQLKKKKSTFCGCIQPPTRGD